MYRFRIVLLFSIQTNKSKSHESMEMDVTNFKQKIVYE